MTTENAYVPQTGRIDAIRTRLGGSGAWAIQNLEYDFNAIGNLTRRADLNLNVSEQLADPDSYDALNRVRRVRRYTGATLAEERTVEYDTLGNVTSKTQLAGNSPGTYDYSTAATCTGITDQVTPGVHAVRRITADSISGDFCYDANGNQRSSWNFTRNRARTVTYTPYNKPKTVTESTTTVTFAYGADRSRFKQVNSATGQTTLYIDGLFERETTGGSTHTYVHYIVAGGAPVAIYENNTASVQKTRYLHRDHLGSVTHLTNESGTVAETLSYDPWGKRRNATTWANAGSQIFATETPRGYTGHEHLDDVSLVHMNGRAYDPDTGRMLSADPVDARAARAKSPALSRVGVVLRARQDAWRLLLGPKWTQEQEGAKENARHDVPNARCQPLLRRLEIGGKADGAALRRWRVHELTDRRENGGDRLVVTLELALELGELASQLGVGGEQLAQLHERAHDVEAHLDGTRTIQDRGGHDRAVLGEGERREARIAVLLRTGRKTRPVQRLDLGAIEPEQKILREPCRVARHLLVETLGR